MANPIVTTLSGRDLDNNSIVFEGTNTLNDWEITAWGFWSYLNSAGEGSKVYIVASGTPVAGDFAKFKTGLLPYSLYKYQARCYYRKWEINEEYPEGHWIYIEVFGDWVDFTTHAYSTTLQVFACNINKSTGTVVFWGSINTPDDGHVVERGFQYGQTKTPGLSVSETGSFSTTEMFSLTVYGLSLNEDFYVRAYLKTASGHYFYTSDGDDRGWAKFTTKVLTKDIVVLSNAGYYPSLSEDFLRVFNKDGQEGNAFKLPSGQGTLSVTIDGLGNAYYGYALDGSGYIGKIRLVDGVIIDYGAVDKIPRGVCIGYGDFIYTLESDTAAKNAILYKRNLLNFGEIAHITLVSTSAYFCGITADEIGNIYVGRTTTPQRIERYGLYTSHDIIDVTTYPIHNIAGVAKHNISGVQSGEAGTCHFQIAGDNTLKFKAGASIIITGSTGNDGTYTIRIDSYYSLGSTYIPVNEAIPDFNADGILTKSGDNSFRIAGDYIADLEEGEQVKVEGSTGNNGTYTISTGGSYLENGNTVIPVDEAIPNATIDGTATEIGEYSFTIEGNHVLEFTDLDDITIAGSTGNNGNYPVAEFGAYREGENTIIPVRDIPIPDPTPDGTLTLAGSGTIMGSLNSSTPLTFGGIAISGGDEYGDFIYAGAWFDLPNKTNKYFSAIEGWWPEPDTDWYSADFFHVGGFKDKVIVEGTPYIGYSRALACYDENGIKLWKTDIVRGIQDVSGYPYPGEASVINTKAERDSTQTAIRLYGEITEIISSDIVEKGFEYIIQDTEPEGEATGIEVIKTRPSYIPTWGIGEYYAYEYEGNNVGFWDRLYNLEENTIWWFRAYCKDDKDNKFTAGAWMKNVPTMITYECTEPGAQEATGNGEMTDKGANIVTRRGFRIIKEYEGDLMGLNYYDSIFGAYTLIGEIEMETLTGPAGAITGYIWRGTFYRDALWPKSITPGYFEVGIYENIIGGGTSGEAFGIYLKPNDVYKIIAIAVNQHGMGFGEEVDLATGINILPSEDDEIVSEISAEKTITLGTIPEGETVTRIGIRLGRTEGCTDIHVYENGSWGSGQSHTFYITGFVPGATYYKMPYIILNHGDYEEEILAIPDYRDPERLEEWLTDYPLEVFPEVEDEDDLNQTVIDASVGDISYRTIIKEIKCEKIGDQSFIDRYGRRRSQTINNHLIQSRENCKTIIDDYIKRFQILKMKVEIDYDIPIPFEREDVILLGDGKHKLREDGEGLIPCKNDGEGEVLQEDFILAKIRKIDIRYIAGLEVILPLELEV